jgi:hypothetical protein
MAISELMKDGINLSSDHPEYTISKLEELKLDLLGKATRNGYDRALVMARNSGGSAGRLRSASQGIFQIVPVNSTDVSDSGSYDTSTIDKTIKAVVTLEFEVVR